MPSQCFLWVLELLYKKFKNLQNTPKNLEKLPNRAHIEGQKPLSIKKRGREDGKKKWDEGLGPSPISPPSLYRGASPFCGLPIYEHLHYLHIGRAQKSIEKEGTPSRGRPPYPSYRVQAKELQSVARKLQNSSSR